ncbi:MAG: UDP-N-acetylmuramoyl-L-alanyl-D-glutamate--2,6-diaminopimelate ligase [bacterium]|nr:UDP-N-acetylmuramoyl-L-alanyl-D-glutamate--2,6-diaminopimelate ligase [bacterium]
MTKILSQLFHSDREHFDNRVATGIAYDSRKVMPGGIFVAIPGVAVDGHQFIPQAVSRGATVIVGEQPAMELPSGVTYIQVTDTRIALAELSSQWFDHPADKLAILAVTGSNGKTTSTYLIERILRSAEKKCAVIGTIGYIIGGEARPAIHTTPESYELQSLFADAVTAGDRFIAVEVSSHALALKRTHGIDFTGAIWTNLTQDHLDFHGTMENYFGEKAKLFLGEGAARIRLVNRDDSYAARMLQDPAILSFGIDSTTANYRATSIKMTANETSFRIVGTSNGSIDVKTSMVGKYNIANILGVAALLDRLGIAPLAIADGIGQLEGVSGRMQRVDSPVGTAIFVDYAHTPDAMENVIKTARSFTQNRLHVLFGCGGNRDRAKRPLMGAAACIADSVVVTSDNPRFEEPQAIVDDIMPGLDRSKVALIELDRTTAIAAACSMLVEGDVLLVLGKGAESYLEIKGVRHPYSDYEAIAQAITKLPGATHA